MPVGPGCILHRNGCGGFFCKGALWAGCCSSNALRSPVEEERKCLMTAFLLQRTCLQNCLECTAGCRKQGQADGFWHMLLQNQEGEVVLKRKVKAAASAITAFEVGPAGQTLAVGTSEGTAIAMC